MFFPLKTTIAMRKPQSSWGALWVKGHSPNPPYRRLLIWTFPSNSRFYICLLCGPSCPSFFRTLAVYHTHTWLYLSRLSPLCWTYIRGHIPSSTLLFPSHSSSVSTTGNRWEVKGVTCRGNGLLPLACQAVITYFHTQNLPLFRGEEKLSWQPLQVPFKCTHTPAALMRAVLSDLLPFCVPLNHHQCSVNSQMLLTLLHQVLRSPKNILTPLIQQLSVISSINWH